MPCWRRRAPNCAATEGTHDGSMYSESAPAPSPAAFRASACAGWYPLELLLFRRRCRELPCGMLVRLIDCFAGANAASAGAADDSWVRLNDSSFAVYVCSAGLDEEEKHSPYDVEWHELGPDRGEDGAPKRRTHTFWEEGDGAGDDLRAARKAYVDAGFLTAVPEEDDAKPIRPFSLSLVGPRRERLRITTSAYRDSPIVRRHLYNKGAPASEEGLRRFVTRSSRQADRQTRTNSSNRCRAANVSRGSVRRVLDAAFDSDGGRLCFPPFPSSTSTQSPATPVGGDEAPLRVAIFDPEEGRSCLEEVRPIRSSGGRPLTRSDERARLRALHGWASGAASTSAPGAALLAAVCNSQKYFDLAARVLRHGACPRGLWVFLSKVPPREVFAQLCEHRKNIRTGAPLGGGGGDGAECLSDAALPKSDAVREDNSSTCSGSSSNNMLSPSCGSADDDYLGTFVYRPMREPSQIFSAHFESSHPLEWVPPVPISPLSVLLGAEALVEGESSDRVNAPALLEAIDAFAAGGHDFGVEFAYDWWARQQRQQKRGFEQTRPSQTAASTAATRVLAGFSPRSSCLGRAAGHHSPEVLLAILLYMGMGLHAHRPFISSSSSSVTSNASDGAAGVGSFKVGLSCLLDAEAAAKEFCSNGGLASIPSALAKAHVPPSAIPLVPFLLNRIVQERLRSISFGLNDAASKAAAVARRQSEAVAGTAPPFPEVIARRRKRWLQEAQTAQRELNAETTVLNAIIKAFVAAGGSSAAMPSRYSSDTLLWRRHVFIGKGLERKLESAEFPEEARFFSPRPKPKGLYEWPLYMSGGQNGGGQEDGVGGGRVAVPAPTHQYTLYGLQGAVPLLIGLSNYDEALRVLLPLLLKQGVAVTEGEEEEEKEEAPSAVVPSAPSLAATGDGESGMESHSRSDVVHCGSHDEFAIEEAIRYRIECEAGEFSRALADAEEVRVAGGEANLIAERAAERAAMNRRMAANAAVAAARAAARVAAARAAARAAGEGNDEDESEDEGEQEEDWEDNWEGSDEEEDDDEEGSDFDEINDTLRLDVANSSFIRVLDLLLANGLCTPDGLLWYLLDFAKLYHKGFLEMVRHEESANLSAVREEGDGLNHREWDRRALCLQAPAAMTRYGAVLRYLVPLCGDGEGADLRRAEVKSFLDCVFESGRISSRGQHPLYPLRLEVLRLNPGPRTICDDLNGARDTYSYF